MTHPETNVPPFHYEDFLDLSEEEARAHEENLAVDAYERQEMKGKYPEGEG